MAVGLVRAAAFSTWLACAASVGAQGVVGPFLVGQMPRVGGLNAGQVPVASVVRVHMVHLPGAPPNLYYCSLGVIGLPTALGGVGNTDILCGTYDVQADVFTPNADAAAINTGGHEYNMVVHQDGLVGVLDFPNNGPYSPPLLVTRAAIGLPWQVVGLIGGLPCCGGGSYTPALATHAGRMHLVYADPRTGEIVMAALDMVTVSVRQYRVIVAPLAASYNTSPVPISSANGGIVGVSHGVVSGSVIDVDHYVSLDLDPSTPPLLVLDTASWTTPGGFVGGRFFGHDYSPGAAVADGIYSTDTCWVAGGRARLGAGMSVSAFCVPTAVTGVHWSMIVGSTSFLTVGVANPLAQGLVGVDLLASWTGPLQQHLNGSGETKFHWVVPNVPALSGAVQPVQSLTWDVVGGAVYWGNTAALRIE